MAFHVIASTLTGSGTVTADTVDIIVDIIKKALALFSEFPLNVFLAGSLLAVGITAFSALRNAA